LQNKNQHVGKTGEAAAQKYLLKENYRILEINFRCRQGEIDIIAQEGEYLVFIEVKTRTSNLFGSPAEAVHFKKQQQICKAALNYLSLKNLHDCDMRFDVVAITSNASISPEIKLFKNAFDYCL
jgi:putative endonuclease